MVSALAPQMCGPSIRLVWSIWRHRTLPQAGFVCGTGLFQCLRRVLKYSGTQRFPACYSNVLCKNRSIKSPCGGSMSKIVGVEWMEGKNGWHKIKRRLHGNGGEQGVRFIWYSLNSGSQISSISVKKLVNEKIFPDWMIQQRRF